MIIRLFPPIYTYPPIHFKKIDMTRKNSGGSIRFPPPPPSPMVQGKDDAMSMQLHGYKK